MLDTDGRTNGHPPLPSHPIGTHTKPVPYFPPENAHAPHPQLRLDRGAGDDLGDDTDHDGDDEQEEHDHSDSPSRSRSRSRPHSPCAPSPTNTPQQQSQPTSPPPPAPSPCAAHVHFHSRVRITSGLRHSRANANHTLNNDSSDSDSPSSSISAPLRFRSHDTGPRAPLIERVSRLAAQARDKRRAAGAAAPKASRMRVNDFEYTPLFRAVVPAAYGATQGGRSGRIDADPGSEVRSRIDGLRGEDDVAFGRWPWRALNRHWWKWQIESILCCCWSDESDADD